MNSILEVADSFDPEFGASLTPIVDDDLRRYSLAERRRVLELKRRAPGANDPLMDGEPRLVARRFSRAAQYRRRALSSGVGQVLPDEQLASFMLMSAFGDIEDGMAVSALVAETIRYGDTAVKARAVHESVMRVVRMAFQLAEATYGSDGQQSLLGPAAAETKADIVLIRPGDRDEGTAYIQKWFKKYATTQILIYDPYFRPDDLAVLATLPLGVAVHIVTAVRGQTYSSLRSPTFLSDVSHAYVSAWRRLSAHDMPTTILTIFGDATGLGPMHDRYAIADDHVLKLGGSLNGVGYRTMDMLPLSPADASAVRTEINSWLTQSMPMLNGRLLDTFRLTLSKG